MFVIILLFNNKHSTKWIRITFIRFLKYPNPIRLTYVNRNIEIILYNLLLEYSGIHKIQFYLPRLLKNYLWHKARFTNNIKRI